VGIAPKWCPFLDNMTEELEENKYRTVYSDYRFVPRDELEALGLEHLIGTNLLRPYMHGFYMDMRLYRRVRAIVDPDAYNKFLASKTQEKIEANRSHRIAIQKNSLLEYNTKQDINKEEEFIENERIKINKNYAKYLINSKGLEKDTALNPLLDPRFSAMFKNQEYVIDFENDPYLRYHPEIQYVLNTNTWKAEKLKKKQLNDASDDENDER